MNTHFRTFWDWLRLQTGFAPRPRRLPVEIVSTRPLYPPPQGRQLALPPAKVAITALVATPRTDVGPVRTITPHSANPAPEDHSTVPSQSRHVARRQVVIRPLRPDEPLETNTETWERHGNSFVTTETRTRVLTAGNMLVSPQQVIGFCGRCGRADQEFLVCGRTGARLCRACVTFFPNHSRPIPVSKDEAKALRKNLNGWDMHDFKKGLKDDTAVRRLFPFLPQAATNGTTNAHA